VNSVKKSDADYLRAVRQLESSLEYYVERTPPLPVNTPGPYFSTAATDPDGNSVDNFDSYERFCARSSEIISHLRNLPPGTLLDVGCGPGNLLKNLSENGWICTGIEPDLPAANFAERFGKVFRGTYESFNSHGKFDVVVLNHVIEHVNNPLKMVTWVKKVIKKDGLLVLSTPDFDSAAARRWQERFRLLHDPTHISLFSSDSLRRMLRDMGFQIEKTEYPFFETPYFTDENLKRLFETGSVSPPFYGSVVTVFSRYTQEEGVNFE
jgi:SAM-dependent methyltransferase